MRNLLVIISILFYSCTSEVIVSIDQKATGTGADTGGGVIVGSNSIELQTLSLTSNDFSKTVFIEIPYSGDVDDDSVITLHFCSIKKQTACNPYSGESITLTKSGSTLIADISIVLSAELSSGDIMKYQLSAIDNDGVSGGYDQGYVFIPYEEATPRSIRQLGLFSFDSGVPELNAADSEMISEMAIGSDGSIYLGGVTNSNLAELNGQADVVIIKLTPSGERDRTFGNQGISQIGILTKNASGNEVVTSFVLDESGSLFVAGHTYGILSGGTSSLYDGFILKVDAINGTLDTEFGDGDGMDNDGIVQINDANTSSGFSSQFISTICLDGLGNIFAAGYTYNSLSGVNAGSWDSFILKMDANSGILSTSFGDGDGMDNDGIVQINASNSNDATLEDKIFSIALDGSGNLFAAGSTESPLSGLNGGDKDAFILKMDANSGVLSTSFGDGDGMDNDGIVQINAMNSNDSVLADAISSIVLDGSGNLFAAGSTSSSLSGVKAGSNDGFILKIDTNSGILSTSFGDGDGMDNDGIVQINATNSNDAISDEFLKSIVLDGSGNLFAAGYTSSSLSGVNAGSNDGFIFKMDTNSGILSTSFGDGDGMDNDGIIQINATNSNDALSDEFLKSIVLDGSGNLFAAGYSSSSLSGVNAGSNDAFNIKMSADSGVLSTSFGDGDGMDNDGIVQINLSSSSIKNSAGKDDYLLSVALDGLGNLYAAGATWSSLSGAQEGGMDSFILKMDAVTGILDTDFGNGDGIDGDGILQVNSMIANDASQTDQIHFITLDGAGNLFAAGYTASNLSGIQGGSSDGFIMKLDANTGVLDSSFGDGDGMDNDGIVQINASNSNSALIWDFIETLALDGAGNLFAGGKTMSALSGPDMGNYDGFIIKMDANSGVLDTVFGDGDGMDNDGIVQFNSNNTLNPGLQEVVESIAIDGAGDLYAAGTTGSILSGAPGGGDDGFVIKMSGVSGIFDPNFGDGDGMDNDGIVQINNTNSNGAGGDEGIFSMVLDGAGNLFIAGSSTSSLSGLNAGGEDGFVIKMDTGSGVLDPDFGDGDGRDNDGIVLINATNSNNPLSLEKIMSISLDGSGNLIAAGVTLSSLSGVKGGSYDGFILKMDTTSGVLDNSFGDGDGMDDDGILQINASNSTDATSSDVLTSIAIDGSGNIFAAGHTSGQMSEVSAGSNDILTIMISAGNDGL